MEDKCRSTVRKKRILTKRYWVHFMSNGQQQTTTSANKEMMDTDENSSDAIMSSHHSQVPPLSTQNLNMAPQFNGFNNQQPSSAGRSSASRSSASMMYKRHSSATIPSFQSISRMHAGLSSDSINSYQSVMSLDQPQHPQDVPQQQQHGMNNGGDSRYHPYKSPRSPRVTNPPGMDYGQPQNHGMSGQSATEEGSVFSPRNYQHRILSIVSPRTTLPTNGGSSILSTLTQSQMAQLSPQQQQNNFSQHPSQQQPTTGFTFPGLDAYKLEGTNNPTSRDLPNLHSAIQHYDNDPSGSNTESLKQTTSNYHFRSVSSQALHNHHRHSLQLSSHGKSLSDTNLLPPPSFLLSNESNPAVMPNGMNNTGLHTSEMFSIPPIVLDQQQFSHPMAPPNSARGSRSSSIVDGSSPRQQLMNDVTTINNSSPRSESGGYTGMGVSPRSDYSYSSDMSGMSSLNSSPRLGSDAGSKRLSANLTSGDLTLPPYLRQQAPGYIIDNQHNGSYANHAGNRKSFAGYLNNPGNRFSLGSAAFTQGSPNQLGLPNGGIPPQGAPHSTTTYTNHPGNRFSLGPNQDLYYGRRSGIAGSQRNSTRQ